MRARTEDDVCRELQQLLSVDPSPNFVARVRTTVASQPAPSRPPAYFITLAASIAAVMLITMVRFGGPASDENAESTFRHEQTIREPIPDVVPETPRAEAAPPGSAPLVHTKPRAPRVPPEPSLQVVVAPEDLQAFQRLVRTTEDGTVALSFDETNRKLTMAELTIEPITTPLTLSEHQQGVVQ